MYRRSARVMYVHLKGSTNERTPYQKDDIAKECDCHIIKVGCLKRIDVKFLTW